MLLYTVPYLLNHQRQVHNHTFGRRLTINNKINHIQWVVDRDPLSINTTLTQFQHVNSLELYYDIKEINPNPCSWCLILPVLHYVEINFDWSPMRAKRLNDWSFTPIHHRCIILDQLRQCAPSLQCLTLWWHDVRLLLKHSNSPWPSIQQLNILLRTHTKDNPSASLIRRLPTIKVFPQLRYLSLGARRFLLTPPELAAERILSWIDALVFSSSKLVVLHVNKNCPYFRTLSSTSYDMLMMLLKQHVRLRDYHHPSAKIIINSNEEVIIWL
ncbi:unnamed protein product [Rotaria sp. Silwood1]|nr:unnamed protein product [Rotaria sp. Silwood1]CAF3421752.1 unnamed protein product [Rotaria sp. Silwood1]CAF4792546.1 unnamed protein product [Rotaria sp. Silwood1]